MRDDQARPIIIKKKKVLAADGHHGGAWKVAYADFVTAMMAFFMLMWLLNATTDKQRRGLADYFSPTAPIASESSGGNGALGGQTLTADTMRVQNGRGGITESAKHGTSEAEEATLKAVEAAVLGKGGESLLDEELLRHVAVRLTDEGLVVEAFDLPGSPLFLGAQPTETLRAIVASIASELQPLANQMALNAFVAAAPVVVRDAQPWVLSSARADALREVLPGAGLSDARVARITGHGDRRPATADPVDIRNNRVELIVLRGTAAQGR